MKYASIAFALIAFVAGVMAARNWSKSEDVTVDPGWALPGTGGHIEPVLPELKQPDMDAAVIRASMDAGALSKIAARWAYMAAIAGLASAVASGLAYPTLSPSWPGPPVRAQRGPKTSFTARRSTPFLFALTKTWMPGTRPGMTF